MKPSVARPHGGVRGANLSRSSLLFGGPFGRIFRSLPAADYGDNDQATMANLITLAAKMSADAEAVTDGPDPEEGGIPAAYTYFGQFIDHDLTFDPASSLQKQNDPDALVDYRTPRFDMDNIYGRGADDQPYLYDGGTNKFILGVPMDGAPQVNTGAHDLPRSQPTAPAAPARAIIGDPRNDENTIVSQLQGLWHRFHNAIVDASPDTASFAQIQQQVRFHYQWILVHDFLPKIIDADVLENVLPGSKAGAPDVQRIALRYFHPKDEAFMPLEFSAAAYRFGHSMVRPEYRLNDTVGPLAIFAGDPLNDLRGFRALPAGWAIDWRRFIDITPLPYGSLTNAADPNNSNRMQLAYKMDTSLVNPLSVLPVAISNALNPVPQAPGGPPPPNPLAQLNLMRGWRMRLPTGQTVAKAMGLVPLQDNEINIGKFTGSDPLITIDQVAPAFVGNCPLWTYILAETLESSVPITVLTNPADASSTQMMQIATRKLGPVGGTIVAETFLGLLRVDSSSYLTLDPLWQPPLAVNGVFGLREMMMYALDLLTMPKL